MREIKFRIWNKNTELFHYYSIEELLVRAHGTICQYLTTPEGLTKPIQQYTGLKDKNGKEIYEGEICEFRYDSSNGSKLLIGDVYYSGCGFYISDRRSVARKADTIERVIGNIYENPELLSQ